MIKDYVDPTTYAVIPRAWKVIDVPDGGKAVAAMAPYPGKHAEDRACTGDDAFISENAIMSENERTRMANICASCKVQTACLEWAIAHEDYGFWSNTTPENRRVLRRSRRQVLVEPEMAHVYGLRPDPFDFLHAGGEDAEDTPDRTSGSSAVA